jgi:hypothetical protein
MSRKTEPAGPSLTFVLFLGFLSFCAGGLLGLVSLVSQPVTVMVKMPEPDEIEPGSVYLVRGERGGRTSWRAKEDAWRAGMVDVLRLSESELNQWSRERFEIKKIAGEDAVSDVRATLEYTPDPVNFRIVGDKLQMSTEVELGGYLDEKTFVYQVLGHFESSSRGVRFVPETGNLGSAPLGMVPVVRDWLFDLVKNRIAGSTDVDWLGESLGQMESVEVVDGQLVLTRNAEG